MLRLSKKRFQIAALGLVVLASWSGWRYAFGVALSSDRLLQAQPCIEISETVWDFGRVTQAAELEAGFLVRNAGSRRLLIVERSRSCDDCPSARNPEVSIPSGGETMLRIVLDTGRFCGAVREQYHYRTNDPDRPTFTLALVAEVQPESARPKSHKVDTTQLSPVPTI